MKTLFLNATVLDTSRTLKLAKHLLQYFEDIYEVDLKHTPIPPVDNDTFNIKYTALKEGNLNHPALKNALLMKEAETIIIAAPVWNVGLPASLKAFFDDALITGLTFAYGEQGKIVSLCKTKRVILVSTAGGKFFKEHTFDFIKDFTNMFLGTNDVTLYKAEFLDVFKDKVDQFLEDTIKEIDRDYK